MVQDVDGVAAAAVGALLGVAHTTDLDAVLGSSDVEAVAICTSTDTHAPLLHLCAAAGKPVFCEKPVSRNLAAVDAALGAIDKAGVALHIGFNRRFDPAHLAVHDAVVAGTIGEVHPVRITHNHSVELLDTVICSVYRSCGGCCTGHVRPPRFAER